MRHKIAPAETDAPLDCLLGQIGEDVRRTPIPGRIAAYCESGETPAGNGPAGTACRESRPPSSRAAARRAAGSGGALARNIPDTDAQNMRP